MKNWEEFVFLPLLAMERKPRSEWRRGDSNSSSKFLPQKLVPPRPVPVGSPPWIYRTLPVSGKVVNGGVG